MPSRVRSDKGKENVLVADFMINLAALHYVYLPKVSEKLEIWNRAWCRHRMRTTKASPMQLWVSGQ